MSRPFRWLGITLGVRWVGGVDFVPPQVAECPEHWFRPSAGPTECLVDQDTGTSSLILYSEGLPDHWYDPNFAGARPQVWEPVFPVRPTAGDQEATPLEPGAVVGFAVNGVPLRLAPRPSSITHLGQDPDLEGADGCLGMVDPESGAYFYTTSPPCLFRPPGAKHKGRHGTGKGGKHKGHSHAERAPDTESPFDLETYLEAFGSAGAGFPSPVIGRGLDGLKIYGPFDERGQPHTGLDACNGKFDERTGEYAYHATQHWPFLVGCFGPGPFTRPLPALDHSAAAKDSRECPMGSYPRGTFEAGARVYGGAFGPAYLGPGSAWPPGGASGGLSQCVKCPAGRLGTAPLGQASLRQAFLGPGGFEEHFSSNGALGGFGGGSREPRAIGPSSGAAACPELCPIGHFCPAGSAAPTKCPSGKWGGQEGLGDSACDGECLAGTFCPEGSTALEGQPCGGAKWFCPQGSPHRLPASEGYYTIIEGWSRPGGVGSFQGQGGNLDQRAGAYAFASASPVRLGHDQRSRLDQRSHGVASVRQTHELEYRRSAQVLCEPGYYCPTEDGGAGGGGSPKSQGLRFPCPAGTFGATPGLTSPNCTGPCPLGHFCPLGSPLPTACPAGTFGAALGLAASACSGLCARGHYCPAGSVKATEVKCPAGSYGPTQGLSSAACSHDCDGLSAHGPSSLTGGLLAGIEAMAAPLGLGFGTGLHASAGVGSGAGPTAAGGLGPADLGGGVGSSRSSQLPGQLPGGVGGLSGGSRAGREGPSGGTGLCQPSLCPSGRYCPPGTGYIEPSTGGGAFALSAAGSVLPPACGGPGVFCPEGSALPTPVRQGHYTVGLARGAGGDLEARLAASGTSEPGRYQVAVDEQYRVSEVSCEPGTYCAGGVRFPCPAGTFGDSSGLASPACSGPCERGYYCPPQSTTARQRDCGGPGVYCPGGVGLPVPVGEGNYSVGIPALRAAQNANDTYVSQELATGWGESVGRPGWYTSEYDPLNTVRDRAGTKWFTGQRAVGHQMYDMAGLGASANRVAQAACPPGAYCEAGVARLCPAGTYGWAFGLRSPRCNGPCAAGHYCPQGSTRRRQLPCPAGRWGGEGNGDEKCSGVCEAGYWCPLKSRSRRERECGGETVYCPPGAAAPLNVSTGFFSAGGQVTTRTGQVACHGERTPPAGALRAGLCPSTTMPLAGPGSWYDTAIQGREYKRTVNDQGVEQPYDPNYG